MARAGAGEWEVTAAAPSFVHGDLRPIPLEPFPGEACRVVPVPAYLTGRPHVMAYGRTLRRLLADPWDLIHCWEEPYVAAGYQVCRWASPGVPLVFWTAQNLPKRYPPPFNWFEQYCLRRCSGWEACGQTIVAALGPRGYADKPHRVLPLGIDTAAFRPDPAAGAAVRKRLGWADPGPPVVGYLGRFVPEKGVRVLTAALDATKTPWRALFVGGGTLESELRAWANRYPDDRVRVLTGVRHDGVPAHLSAMDVLAAPSQTTRRWKEQLGRMLIEAMACGVPVAGSDSGEIPHVIADAGLVLPEADPAAWASGLTMLLESPNRRTELAARGLDRVATEFTWPVVARRHLDFFNTITSPESLMKL
jgi:glycosyltransferase involved in cell wall biosynthesis